MRIKWDTANLPSQTGRIAIVTGANSGLGFETVKLLAGKSMKVILASRNEAKANAAITNIKKTVPDAQIEFIPVDLASLASVRNFAETFLKSHDKLHLLINNAGIMMPPFQQTEDGFESQFATNYLGHFLLTALLFPAIKDAGNSRIVSLGSIAHRAARLRLNKLNSKKGYNRVIAYANSKLACIIFGYELQRRLQTSGYQVISVAAHPGLASTNLGKNLPPVIRNIFPMMGHSSIKGAQSILIAALHPDVKGGQYFGPGGFMEMYGKPTLAGSGKISKDLDIAKKLWDLTEDWVGEKFVI